VGALKRNIPQADTDLEKLNDIELHVTRMKGLLEDVLNAGKNEARKLKAQDQEIDLIEFLNQIIAEVSAATDFTHRFVTDFLSPEIIFMSDEKLLRNVFINLFSNAIKFSPGKTEVYVSVKEENENILITVRDSGIGITSDDMEKLFEAFHRGANTTGIKGTGLGLSIVKKALETLGGEISVETVPEVGTSFFVVLRKGNGVAGKM
jgi:signal transduction histidine kinase